MIAQSVLMHPVLALSATKKRVKCNPLQQQEWLVKENIDVLCKSIEDKMEDLDNDCKETIEMELFGLNIYVDVATRGWDYRSIELLAVDVMNADCDALNGASRMLFNALTETIARMNREMDEEYGNNY
ncbi:hypothetical protein D0T53_11260 [Dysgonomonas sp. 216]|uniref:hypothetical protein n=1 Tax=Dysgonomonas sp. 216 TaxID=2302934 RepID=UPI0013D74047|nr:hypothetical protein [Dysgonomonas sp. 216]NDW19483.1 hypothetical protein [Dysgonomonas sp. 216]